MPPPSSSNSQSRQPRLSDDQRRRKRYSLRIEFLDDEEDELERALGVGGERTSRTHHREPSAVRGRDYTEPERSRGSDNRRSRHASVSSTAAVVGSPSLPGVEIRQVQQLQETMNRISMRLDEVTGIPDPDPFAPPPQHQQQAPPREREGNRGRLSGSGSRRQQRRDASTQTLIRGYDPYTAGTPTSPLPFEYPAVLQNRGRRDDSLEKAYFDGFLLGQRLANAHQHREREAVPPVPIPPPPRPASARPGPGHGSGGHGQSSRPRPQPQPHQASGVMRALSQLVGRYNRDHSPPPSLRSQIGGGYRR